MTRLGSGNHQESYLTIFGRQTRPSSIRSAPIAPALALQDHGFPQIGEMVKHYELLRQLGEGAMGTVYLAHDTMRDRFVAIKVPRIPSGPSAERFLSEAQATARCKHDNIVAIHEVDEIDGCPYMVLEYLEGRTLRAWMAQRDCVATFDLWEGDAVPSFGGVSPRLAVELVIPVVRALSCAHKRGIVHRDLKPENIFLTEAGRVVVLDFGIAKHLDGSERPAIAPSARPRPGRPGVALTQEGTILGTLPYMSPEQVRSESVDARSDLWSVGIMLYELVAGSHPLMSGSACGLLAIGDVEVSMPRLRDRRPDVGALGAIVDRCLQKQRDRRYRSAEELLAALEAVARLSHEYSAYPSARACATRCRPRAGSDRAMDPRAPRGGYRR